MDYTFKELKLSDAEKFWLGEIFKANFTFIDINSMKVKFWKKLPENFNPSAIDNRLIRDNRLTLIGLWHVYPNSPIFSQVSKAIEVTRDLILKNPGIKVIRAREISQLVDITEREGEIVLMLIYDLGGFFSSASGSNKQRGFREANFPQDYSAYDEFLKFENLEQKMEQFFINHATRTDSRRKLSKEQSMAKSGTFWKQPSSKDIWSDIFEDFEVTKRTFGKNINFVTDSHKRKAIFRDIEQSYVLSKNGYYKPAVILAGSVIEELLRLYLKTKKVKPANNTFDEYIKACENSGFLKGAVNRLSDSVRQFRNLVHLQKETSTKHKITKAAAKNAVSSIFIVSSDF